MNNIKNVKNADEQWLARTLKTQWTESCLLKFGTVCRTHSCTYCSCKLYTVLSTVHFYLSSTRSTYYKGLAWLWIEAAGGVYYLTTNHWSLILIKFFLAMLQMVNCYTVHIARWDHMQTLPKGCQTNFKSFKRLVAIFRQGTQEWFLAGWIIVSLQAAS